jgi:hypothetical protein
MHTGRAFDALLAYGFCKAGCVLSPDPRFDIAQEGMGVSMTTSSAWAAVEPETTANAMTSRVIPFVLGFALASLIAWIGSLPAVELQATPRVETMAPTGETVAIEPTAVHMRAADPRPAAAPASEEPVRPEQRQSQRTQQRDPSSGS